MRNQPFVTCNLDGSVSLVWPTDKQTTVSISRELLEHIVGEINYRRKPTLTDEEREAVEKAAWYVEAMASGDLAGTIPPTLRGLLERTGGER